MEQEPLDRVTRNFSVKLHLTPEEAMRICDLAQEADLGFSEYILFKALSDR